MTGEDDSALHDQIIATGMVSLAFQVQTLVGLAKRENDPAAFVRGFVAELHARIDANDQRMPNNAYPQIHEFARHIVDRMGGDALDEVRGWGP
jgi:hypothetical protein